MMHPQRLRDRREERRDRARAIAQVRRAVVVQRRGPSNWIGLALVALAVSAALTWKPGAGVESAPLPVPAMRVDPIELLAPRAGTGPEVTFRWRAVGAPRAWQVVVVDRAMVEVARSEPSAVGADALPMPPELASALVPGVAYLWQVVAVGHGPRRRSGLCEFQLAAH